MEAHRAVRELGNGHIRIDTNAIENCFRPGKILLKNVLFIAHPAAGWITAVLGTVFVTCRLVGVNPFITWFGCSRSSPKQTHTAHKQLSEITVLLPTPPALWRATKSYSPQQLPRRDGFYR